MWAKAKHEFKAAVAFSFFFLKFTKRLGERKRDKSKKMVCAASCPAQGLIEPPNCVCVRACKHGIVRTTIHLEPRE